MNIYTKDPKDPKNPFLHPARLRIDDTTMGAVVHVLFITSVVCPFRFKEKIDFDIHPVCFMHSIT